jgi:HK97 family phage major capsid protein
MYTVPITASIPNPLLMTPETRLSAALRTFTTRGNREGLKAIADRYGVEASALSNAFKARPLPAKSSPSIFSGEYAFGNFLQAVARAGTPGGLVDPRLKAGPTGLNESIGSDGGFLVQTDRDTSIRQRTYEVGYALQRVNRLPLKAGSNGIKLPAIDETSRADGQRYGGIRSYWMAEAGQKIASQPKFREMDLRLRKLTGLVYCTDELLADAVALQGFIDRALPEELRFRAEDAIFNGSGAGQPLGFINSPATIVVPKESVQTPGSGTIMFENVLNMWSRMWAPSRANSAWFIDQSVEPALATMTFNVGISGVPVYLPASGASGTPYSTLFGRPVVPVEYLPQLGTKGDIVLADLSQYVWTDIGQIQQAASMHVRFIYDEMVFRFVWRVDGQPEWNAPLTPKNGGPTTAPFVVLETR